MKNGTIITIGVLGLAGATLAATTVSAFADRKSINRQLESEREIAKQEIKANKTISPETQARILKLEELLKKTSAKQIRKR